MRPCSQLSCHGRGTLYLEIRILVATCPNSHGKHLLIVRTSSHCLLDLFMASVPTLSCTHACCCYPATWCQRFFCSLSSLARLRFRSRPIRCQGIVASRFSFTSMFYFQDARTPFFLKNSSMQNGYLTVDSGI